MTQSVIASESVQTLLRSRDLGLRLLEAEGAEPIYRLVAASPIPHEKA